MSNLQDLKDELDRFARDTARRLDELSDVVSNLEDVDLTDIADQSQRVRSVLEEIDIIALEDAVDTLRNQVSDVESALDDLDSAIEEASPDSF